MAGIVVEGENIAGCAETRTKLDNFRGGNDGLENFDDDAARRQ